MGFEFKIDADAGIVYIKAEGDTSGRDFIALHEAIRTHSEWDSNFLALFDLQASKLDITADDSQAIGYLRSKFQEAKRIAVVVSSESYGLLRMVQGWSGDDVNLAIFLDMESARKWLGLPSEDDP